MIASRAVGSANKVLAPAHLPEFRGFVLRMPAGMGNADILLLPAGSESRRRAAVLRCGRARGRQVSWGNSLRGGAPRQRPSRWGPAGDAHRSELLARHGRITQHHRPGPRVYAFFAPGVSGHHAVRPGCQMWTTYSGRFASHVIGNAMESGVAVRCEASGWSGISMVGPPGLQTLGGPSCRTSERQLRPPSNGCGTLSPSRCCRREVRARRAQAQSAVHRARNAARAVPRGLLLYR